MLPAILLAAFVFCSAVISRAQVAPSARVRGIPIGFGVGISDYSIDYGPGRRMQGPVAWLDVGIWRGIGIDGSVRSLLINTPPGLSRMQQTTFLGGVHYEARPFFHVRPFARIGVGGGLIEFPSNDPLFTRAYYNVVAPSVGVEFHLVEKAYLRGEYEYEFWRDYMGPHYLNPKGATVGVTYYFSGIHTRPHLVN
jgi:hypothetical protein